MAKKQKTNEADIAGMKAMSNLGAGRDPVTGKKSAESGTIGGRIRAGAKRVGAYAYGQDIQRGKK